MSEPGCKAEPATEPGVKHLDKGQEEVTPTDWPKLIQTVGFPAVACLAIAWFANSAIEWEREQMLPALENTAKAIEKNTQVLQALPENMRKDIDRK